jgi:hypothetical protein
MGAWLSITDGLSMTAFQGKPVVHWKPAFVCSWPDVDDECVKNLKL